MSLIVTSNVNLNDKPGTSDIHRAYSWSNRLSNTFKIEADSEIAVQSVKINKNGLISVGEYNSNYSMYLGETLDEDLLLEESVYHPVADSVIRDGVKDLTTNEFAERIETSMKKNIMNPAFYDTDGTVAVSVSPNVDTGTGRFEGYKYNVEQSPEPLDVIPPDASATSVFESSRFTYVDGIMTRVDAVAPETNGSKPRGCCAVFPDKPVLLSGDDTHPSVEFDISFATGADKNPWACGLTRYNLASPFISPTTGDIIGFAPPYYDGRYNPAFGPFQNMFFDYVVVRDIQNKLRIYQSCVDTSTVSGDNLVMREVIYYHNGNGVFKNGVYDLSTNTTGYTRIRFKIENNGIELDIGHNGAFDVLVNTTLGAKPNMFYPRSCLQNFLYPQIYINKVGTAIAIAERNTYKSLTQATTTFSPESSDVDWVARLISTGKSIKWGKPLENREHNDFNPALGTTAYSYSGFYPYSAGGSSGGWLEDVQMNIVLAPTVEYGLEYTSNANTQYSFGFTGRSLAIGTFNAATGGTSLKSTNAPILTSDKSLFIRVNNLTQNSVNAQLGNAYSKIISHLPRFDSAGNEVGSLFLQSNQLVYVALNNPADIFLNSFDIDIVYDNETYAECLSGKTIVVLHIRKKK